MTTLTTEETWQIDGVNLTNLGIGTELLTTSTERRTITQPGPRRDGAAVIFGAGVGPRRVTLACWVRDADTDGAIASPARSALWQNLDAVAAAMNVRHRLIPLERTRRVGGALTAMTALVAPEGGQQVSEGADGVLRASFGLVMPYPWFRGAEQVDEVTGASGTVTVGGTNLVRAVTVELQASSAWDSPTVTNDETGTSVTFEGVISAGDVVSFDTWAGVATLNGAGSVIGDLTWVGGLGPFALAPGVNPIGVASNGGSGTARIIHQPHWDI